MTYIRVGTTSFTGSSSVEVANVFSATYTHYLVVRGVLGSVATQNIGVRLGTGTPDSGTNYRDQNVAITSATLSSGRNTGQTSWAYALGSTEATEFGYASMRISNPFDAARTTAWADCSVEASGNIYIRRIVMEHDLATSYTGFTVIPASGTITGTITVYGLKES